MPYRPTHDQPLPGDLVVKAVAAGSDLGPRYTYIVTSYPQAEPSAGPYQSLGYAVRKARELAVKHGLAVWREDGNAVKPSYENLTELGQ
jgi:hypothetical protein